MDTARDELERSLNGVGWDCSPHGREGLRAAFEGADGEPVLKLFGPDLKVLLELAEQVKPRLENAAGVRSVHILPVKGQTHLEFRVDADKCARWGITVAEVNNIVHCALGGQTMSSLTEGEKTFDITVRWPERLRRSEQAILDIPVDVTGRANKVPEPAGPAVRLLRLGDLVSPVDANGFPDPKGKFSRPTATAIYRENGKRLILLQLILRGQDLSSVRTEVQKEIVPLLKTGYRLEWDR